MTELCVGEAVRILALALALILGLDFPLCAEGLESGMVPVTVIVTVNNFASVDVVVTCLASVDVVVKFLGSVDVVVELKRLTSVDVVDGGLVLLLLRLELVEVELSGGLVVLSAIRTGVR